MTNRDEILKNGFLDVRVLVSGLRQMHRLNVVIESTAQGQIPFLVSKHYIPTNELLRVAQQTGLPVKHKETVVYPPGMAAGDFRAKPQVLATVETDAVIAEIEE
ncbi:MAG: hypothetical protein ACP5N9_06585 [Candidatus Bilamarchaeum sp.]|jgi:hypothetical protein